MADDAKAGMNLGSVSNTVTNINKDILQLATTIENTLLPKVQSVARAFSGMGVGGGGGSGNGGGNQIASSPSGSNTNKIAMGAAAVGIATAGLPNISTAVMQDYLTQRSTFYGFGGATNSAQVRSLQKSMANTGTALNSMDTTNAIIAAQNAGLGGVSNFNKVMAGVATASNMEPGMGQTAIAQAVAGTMNAPTTVNLARTIGINIRGSDGSMLPLPQLIDQIWNYLNKTSGGNGMDPTDLQYSMQPGYGIYNMVSGLFNGDPVMMKLVFDGLITKAKMGGKTSLSSLTRNQATSLGLQSATTRNMAAQVSAQTNLLTATSSATAGGYAGAADIGTGMNNLAASMSDLTAALGGGKGFGSTALSIGGGALKMGAGLLGGKLLGKTSLGSKGLGEVLPIISKLIPSLADVSISDLLPLLGFGLLAEGGSADGKAPYIVGEKGPELFVPKTDGVVVPNHMLGLNRDKGGGAKAGGGTPMEIYNFLLKNGLSPSGATGVVGNLVAESNLNPLSVGDSGTSGGIAQWHNTRWSNLKAFAEKNHLSPTSVTAQEKFLVSEMKTNYPSLWKTLSSKGITEGNAAALFMQQYERPLDQSTSAAQKRANLGVQAIKGKWDPTVTVSSGPSGTSTSTSSTVVPQADPTAASRFAAAQAAAFGGQVATGNNVNYGGFTININGVTDPNKVAAEVKKILQNPAQSIGKS